MQGFFAKNHGSPKYRLINKEGETMPVILHTVSMCSRDDCATFEGTILPGEYYRKTTEKTINDVWPNMYITTAGGRHSSRSFLTEQLRNRMYGWSPEPGSEMDRYIKNDVETTKMLISHVRNEKYFGIKKVIFNDPATIVFWNDGSKTVVKCQEGDIFDPEKGLAMAISKRALGDKGNFNDVFKKWVPEEKKVDIIYPVVNIGFDGSKFTKVVEEQLNKIFNREPEFINHYWDKEDDQR